MVSLKRLPGHLSWWVGGRDWQWLSWHVIYWEPGSPCRSENLQIETELLFLNYGCIHNSFMSSQLTPWIEKLHRFLSWSENITYSSVLCLDKQMWGSKIFIFDSLYFLEERTVICSAHSASGNVNVIFHTYRILIIKLGFCWQNFSPGAHLSLFLWPVWEEDGFYQRSLNNHN